MAYETVVGEIRDLERRLITLREQATNLSNKRGRRRVLFLGAGLSSPPAIKYLLDHASELDITLRVGDANLELAQSRVGAHTRNHESSRAQAFSLDCLNLPQLSYEIQQADVVISLLPMAFHPSVAAECVKQGKHMVTASYVSDAMKALHAEAKEKGLVLLNEMGLDPGIDHMICMRTINRLQTAHGPLRGFESFTGGLVAPESDDNPWNYKFSWNPRNVVLAGQGGVKFIHHGRFKYIPYHKIFSRYEVLDVPGHGAFEGYANRDSLKYRQQYNLMGVPTMYRGTLRKIGFCKAWNIFVQLGMTDDTLVIEDSQHMTYRQFINSFLLYRRSDSVELKIAYELGISIDSPEMAKLKWLGIFEERPINLPNATAAQILQSLLERKLKMRPEDKDMIVMINKFEYDDSSTGKTHLCQSHGVFTGAGTSATTAMATTVGLPLAMGTRMLLQNRIKDAGVLIPTTPNLYEPILQELETFGIQFEENENFEIKDSPLL
ncbi:MAG: saccharopine dehydrogenase C-terminal domain-containing protein [archaeon]|nr:saccharopine dehydrogenase C-terminal domain-containing protein [archaeon]